MSLCQKKAEQVEHTKTQKYQRTHEYLNQDSTKAIIRQLDRDNKKLFQNKAILRTVQEIWGTSQATSLYRHVRVAQLPEDVFGLLVTVLKMAERNELYGRDKSSQQKRKKQAASKPGSSLQALNQAIKRNQLSDKDVDRLVQRVPRDLLKKNLLKLINKEAKFEDILLVNQRYLALTQMKECVLFVINFKEEKKLAEDWEDLTSKQDFLTTENLEESLTAKLYLDRFSKYMPPKKIAKMPKDKEATNPPIYDNLPLPIQRQLQLARNALRGGRPRQIRRGDALANFTDLACPE